MIHSSNFIANFQPVTKSDHSLDLRNIAWFFVSRESQHQKRYPTSFQPNPNVMPSSAPRNSEFDVSASSLPGYWAVVVDRRAPERDKHPAPSCWTPKLLGTTLFLKRVRSAFGVQLLLQTVCFHTFSCRNIKIYTWKIYIYLYHF